MRSSLLFALAAVVGLAGARAETFIVSADGSGDFTTIQDAIDAAIGGDVIELVDAVYEGKGNRDLEFEGKAITLQSAANNPASCIVNMGGVLGDRHRFADFYRGEGPDTRIRNLSLRKGVWHGPGIEHGGAVLCRAGSSPTFERCFLDSCHADGYGGAVHCSEGAAPAFLSCSFRGNHTADGGGAAISCADGANVLVVDCWFRGNHAGPGAGAIGCMDAGTEATMIGCTFLANEAMRGGAVAVQNAATATLNECTLRTNRAIWGGALWTGFSGHVVLENCTLYGNAAQESGSGLILCEEGSAVVEKTIISWGLLSNAVELDQDCQCRLTCTDIYGNEGGDWTGLIAGRLGIEGNISEDPRFCNVSQANFHLHGDSPCAQGPCGLIGAWTVGCGSPGAVKERCTAGDGSAMNWSLDSTPNPFRSHVEISLGIPGERDGMTLEAAILDVAGRLVRSLVTMPAAAGVQRLSWDGTDRWGRRVAGGVYYCRVDLDGRHIVRPLILRR